MFKYYRVNFDHFSLDISVKNKENINRRLSRQLSKELRWHHLGRTIDRYGFDYVIKICNTDPTDDWDVASVRLWKHDNPHYTYTSITELPDCEGCRWESPAQLDHMDIGGCLYQEF